MFISTTRKPTQHTARGGLQAPVGGHVGKATCLLPFPDPAVIEHTRTWQSLNLRTRPTQAVVTVPGCHRHGRAPPRRRRGRWRGQVRFLSLPSLGQRGPGKSARGPADRAPPIGQQAGGRGRWKKPSSGASCQCPRDGTGLPSSEPAAARIMMRSQRGGVTVRHASWHLAARCQGVQGHGNVDCAW